MRGSRPSADTYDKIRIGTIARFTDNKRIGLLLVRLIY